MIRNRILTDTIRKIEQILDRRWWSLSRMIRGAGRWASVKIVRYSGDHLGPIVLCSDLVCIPRLCERFNLKANDWHKKVE